MKSKVESAVELAIDFYHYLTEDWVIGLSFLLSLISTVCCAAIVIMYLFGLAE